MALQPGYPTGSVEAIVPSDRGTFFRNRVSWGAILAGVAAALVIQLLINILGLGVGMSSLDAVNTYDNPTASCASMAAAIWWTASGIIASFAGGIVAGRLCGTSDGNTAAGTGFVSWCAATLLIFYLLTSAVGGLIGGTLNALGSTIGAVGRGAATAVSGAAQTVAQNTDGDALQERVKRLVNPDAAQTAQDNALDYIRASVNGNQQQAEAARDRAVDSLARAANISPEEARTRLQQAEQQAKQAAQDAKQAAQRAAEATRKAVATASIYGFVALLLGAIAAWFGGGIGAPRRETEVVPVERL